jgi:hypothetical protein
MQRRTMDLYKTTKTTAQGHTLTTTVRTARRAAMWQGVRVVARVWLTTLLAVVVGTTTYLVGTLLLMLPSLMDR